MNSGRNKLWIEENRKTNCSGETFFVVRPPRSGQKVPVCRNNRLGRNDGVAGNLLHAGNKFEKFRAPSSDDDDNSYYRRRRAESKHRERFYLIGRPGRVFTLGRRESYDRVRAYRRLLYRICRRFHFGETVSSHGVGPYYVIIYYLIIVITSYAPATFFS